MCRRKGVCLQELWLKENRLASLPEEIGDCVRLKRLWLDDNRLQALPESITRLACLQELYVPHNRLTALPAGLVSMPALRKLCAAHLCQQCFAQPAMSHGSMYHFQKDAWLTSSTASLACLAASLLCRPCRKLCASRACAS